jgi:GTPase SAR1 family protein
MLQKQIQKSNNIVICCEMNVRRSDGVIVLRWVVLYYKNRERIRKRKGYSNMQKERLQQSWMFWKEGEEGSKKMR